MKKFTHIINEAQVQFDPEELKMGIKIESEHCDIYDELDKWLKKTYGDEYYSIPWKKEEFYEKIAKAHLREIPDYYSRLKIMEKEADNE